MKKSNDKHEKIMDNIKTIEDEPIASLIKLRVLGYIKNDILYIHNYQDAINGKTDILGEVELDQISKMDFLSGENILVLMDVFIDSNRVPRMFLPLRVVRNFNHDTDLESNKLKITAKRMHKNIIGGYPFKEIL